MPNQPKRSIAVASVNWPTIRKAVVATTPIFDRDREDHEDAHQPAREHPFRAGESRAEAVGAPARDKQHDEPGEPRDDDGTRQRLDAADAVAEPSLHGDLGRPAEPGEEGDRGGESGRAHRPDATRPSGSQNPVRRDRLAAMSEVLTSRDGAVLTITLNRPDVFNAFNRDLHAALRVALEEASEPEVRAVVITGAGRGFSAGQDLREFNEIKGSLTDALEETYHPNIRLIRALEKPVIAAVNGPAAGAGLSLASACDVRVASSSAAFVPGFVGIGLVPDSGGSWFLHRLLGFARAFEWMSSNRKLGADEALAWGLVSEVIPAEEFEARVAEIAATWAALPTRAIAMTKQLFERAATASLEEQLALEAELQEAAVVSADFAEGVAAFLEKRPPSFTGA